MFRRQVGQDHESKRESKSNRKIARAFDGVRSGPLPQRVRFLRMPWLWQNGPGGSCLHQQQLFLSICHLLVYFDFSLSPAWTPIVE